MRLSRRSVLVLSSAVGFSGSVIATQETDDDAPGYGMAYGESYGSGDSVSDDDSGNWLQQIVSRDFSVSVSDRDDKGTQLPIEANADATGGRVSISETDDGVHLLNIDATGLPTDSVVTFGQFDDDGTLHTDVNSPGAFTVTNHNAFDVPIDLQVQLANVDLDDSTVELVLDDGSVVTDGIDQIVTLDYGESVDAGVWIDTVDEAVGELTIDIIFTATADES